VHESVVGTFRTWRDVRLESAMRTKADVRRPLQIYGFTPQQTFSEACGAPLRPALILPDGQISHLPVQPHLQKYFRSRLTQITSISLTVSFHTEGRIARRHERGTGCGGRESARRAMAIAGRDEPRERSCGARDDRRFSGRQSRVVLAPVAGVKFAEARRPDRVRQNLNPRTTVTRRIRRRGEHEISRKTIARGRPGYSGEPSVTTLVCFT